MKNFGLGLAVLVIGANGFAADVQSVRCFHDMRPVDGNLSEVTLTVQNDGKYEARHRVVTSGFGGPSEEIVKTIAKGLTCKFAKADQRLLSCTKSASEEGETQNSGLIVHHVTTRGVKFSGDIESFAKFEVTAYSPAFPKHFKLEIPARANGIPSGCEVN